MRLLRRYAVLCFLALAFAAGQQLALLHGLAHAVEKVAQKQDQKPLTAPCDQCALLASLSGAPGPGIPAVDIADGAVALAPFTPDAAPARFVAVFRSRAPPALL